MRTAFIGMSKQLPRCLHSRSSTTKHEAKALRTTNLLCFEGSQLAVARLDVLDESNKFGSGKRVQSVHDRTISAGITITIKARHAWGAAGRRCTYR